MNKFIFFGSPDFSKIVLEKLINFNFLPQAIVCNPDRPVGRKKIITPPPTKKLILDKKLESKIKIFQPEILDENFVNILKELYPKFGIVCAYAKILPQTILDIFPAGILGIHPSLLPKYRGPSPIQTAILDGQKLSGITIYLLDDKVDHGPILAQKECSIENLNFQEVSQKLAELAGNLLCELLPQFLENKIKPIPQDDKVATYTKKLKTEDGFVDFADLKLAQEQESQVAQLIYRKVKALNPDPGVWTIKNNKRIKILDAKLINNKLQIFKIQIEGQKPKILKEKRL